MLYDMQGIEGHIVKEESTVEDWVRGKINDYIKDEDDFDEEEYLKRGIETAPAFIKLFKEALKEL